MAKEFDKECKTKHKCTINVDFNTLNKQCRQIIKLSDIPVLKSLMKKVSKKIKDADSLRIASNLEQKNKILFTF